MTTSKLVARACSACVAGGLVLGAVGAAQAGLVQYQAAVNAQSSLVSYYTFDAGNAADTKGTNHGTPTNVLFVDSTLYGGRAAQFSGGGYISAGVVPAFDFADSTGTFEAWFKPTWTTSPGYNPAIAAVRNGGPVRWSIHENLGRLQLDVWTGTLRSYRHEDTGSDWHHLVAVFDNGNATMYVDGRSLGTQSLPLGSGTGLPFLIGASSTAGAESWIGQIDEVALYADALPASTVLSHYEAMYPTVRTWNFETGDMDGWYAVAGPGNNQVFSAGNQPAYRPFVSFNEGIQNVPVEGNYFVRTYDGKTIGAGDGATGVAETTPFILGQNARITFAISGGNHPFTGDPDSPLADITAVNLERLVGPNNWEMVRTATGFNEEVLRPVAWDLSAYAGQTVRLRIYDTSSGSWGQIGVDDIRYSTSSTPVTTGLWSVDIQATPGLVATTMFGSEATYGRGNFWNAFVVNHHTATSANPSMALVDSDGNPTGVTFSIQGTVSGYNNAGVLKEDYLFIAAGSADPNVNWSLTGLEPSGWYQMFLYGGSIAGRDFNMLIDANGNGTLADDSILHVTSAGVLAPMIVASPSGTIMGQMLNLGHEGNWAGFQLLAIPEPSSLVLLGPGLLGLATCGRRLRTRARRR